MVRRAGGGVEERELGSSELKSEYALLGLGVVWKTHGRRCGVASTKGTGRTYKRVATLRICRIGNAVPGYLAQALPITSVR